MWAEANSCVSYPIKDILVSLVSANKIDMSNEVTQFYNLWVTCRASHHGLKVFIEYGSITQCQVKKFSTVPWYTPTFLYKP